jgi:peptide/nickel transport system permease protein
MWVPFAGEAGRRGVGAVLAASLCAYTLVALIRLGEIGRLPLGERAVILAGWALLYAGTVWSARGRGRWRRRFETDASAMAALCVLVGMMATSLVAPLVVGSHPADVAPATRYQAPSTSHPMGTDRFGRDVWSRVVHGGRASFGVCALSVALAVAIGTLFGAVSGIAPRRLDDAMMRGVDGLLSFPRLLLLLTAVALAPPGAGTLAVFIAVTGWMGMARIVRGEVRRMRGREFVDAAVATGVGKSRLLARHLLPNALGALVVAATLNAGTVILVESSLSFLGLGLAPPTPSWGGMVFDGRDALGAAWWVSAFPALAITVAVVALNLIGDGVRDALDARSSMEA